MPREGCDIAAALDFWMVSIGLSELPLGQAPIRKVAARFPASRMIRETIRIPDLQATHNWAIPMEQREGKSYM